MKKRWPTSKNRQNCTCQNNQFHKGNKGQITGLLFIAPSLFGVSVFVVLPFVDVIRRSFTETVSGSFVGLQNYLQVFHSDVFHLAAANTLKFAVICIPILVGASLLCAVLVNSIKHYGNMFKTAFLLPLAIPAASVVFIWQLFFHQNGLLNHLLSWCGLTPVDFMNTSAAFWVLVGSYLWKNIGYDMVLWLAGLSNVADDLYEAAQLDGAGAIQRFFYITLPNVAGVCFTIFVLSLLNSFKVFREAYLVAGEYPHTSMYLLQHLFNHWFANMDMEKLSAGAVVTAMAIFGLILLLQKAWGETYD